MAEKYSVVQIHHNFLKHCQCWTLRSFPSSLYCKQCAREHPLYVCVCVCVCVYTHIYIYTFVPVCSVVSLCDPMDHSPPDSSVHGIFQARRVEWVAIFLLQGNFPTQGSNLNTCLYHFHWHQIKLKVPLTVASTSLSLFFFHIFAISNYFNL